MEYKTIRLQRLITVYNRPFGNVKGITQRRFRGVDWLSLGRPQRPTEMVLSTKTLNGRRSGRR